ncbi:MAG: EthD family reductase [Chloroflexi bacterium]|nr:EthD family reductase [Chloroflexota bacterium]
MHKFVSLWNLKPEVAIEAAERQYYGVHVPMACRIPGVRRYTVARSRGRSPRFFRIAELYFDDKDACKAGLGSDQGKRVLGDPEFQATLSEVVPFFAEEQVVIPGAGLRSQRPVKIVNLWTWKDDVNPDEADRYYVERHVPLAFTNPGLARYHTSRAVGKRPAFARIAELYFEDMETCKACLRSPEMAKVLDDKPFWSKVKEHFAVFFEEETVSLHEGRVLA